MIHNDLYVASSPPFLSRRVNWMNTCTLLSELWITSLESRTEWSQSGPAREEKSCRYDLSRSPRVA